MFKSKHRSVRQICVFFIFNIQTHKPLIYFNPEGFLKIKVFAKKADQNEKISGSRARRGGWEHKFSKCFAEIFFLQNFWKHECECILTYYLDSGISIEKFKKLRKKEQKFTIRATASIQRLVWIDKWKKLD